MKRIFCVATAAAMLLGLAACGSQQAEEAAATPEPVATETPAPAATPEPTAEPAVEQEPAAVHLCKYTTYDATFTEDGATQLVTGFCQGAMLSSEDEETYPELAAGLKSYFDGYTADWRSDYDMTAEAALGYYEDMNTSYGLSSVENSIAVRRADSTAVSFLFYSYYYAGGAHPSTVYGAVNFNAETGSVLTLNDIFTDTTGLADKISAKLKEDRPEAEFFDEDPATTISSMMQEGTLVWTLDTEAITFWFSAYDLAPYAEGSFAATFSFIELEDIMTEGWDRTPACIAVEIPQISTGYNGVTLQSMGVSTSILLTGEGSGDIFETLCVSANGEETRYEVPGGFYSMRGYYLTMAGADYVYAVLTSDNDYEYFFWLNLTNGDNGILSNLGEAGYYDSELGAGVTELITDPLEMRLSSRLNVFSTTFGYKTYALSAHGEPVSEDPEYVLTSGFELTGKVDLDVRIMDEAYGEPDHDDTLPAGTVYTVYGTDGDSYIEASLDDGECCRIYGSFSEWPQQVAGGYSAEDAFDGVRYAG